MSIETVTLAYKKKISIRIFHTFFELYDARGYFDRKSINYNLDEYLFLSSSIKLSILKKMCVFLRRENHFH